MPQSQSPARPGIDHIVRAAASGDQRAWNELVERYSGLVWSVARAHRLDAAEAADVVQTSWLRLVEHLDRIQNPAGLGAWLATTARRESLLAIRRAGRCQPTDRMEALAPPDPTAIDEQLLTSERDTELWEAFGRLRAGDQALLRLLVADPAPGYQEIGAALDMPVGSIGPTRARALERLRVELAKLHSAGHRGSTAASRA
jgi:RNA polymerase sigma factor (sigma-70 family)